MAMCRSIRWSTADSFSGGSDKSGNWRALQLRKPRIASWQWLRTTARSHGVKLDAGRSGL
jgi:hypothetical protein